MHVADADVAGDADAVAALGRLEVRHQVAAEILLVHALDFTWQERRITNGQRTIFGPDPPVRSAGVSAGLIGKDTVGAATT